MKQNNNLTQPVILISKRGQLAIKKVFFVKSIKKFYRFIILELF
jgi:hypothetical protein